MNNYKELKVWQTAIDIAEAVYQLTSSFPSEEKYGLISQLRRASVSVAANIAEGAGRNTNGEFRQMLGIAYGSLCEVETQLILANRFNMISEEQLEKQSIQVGSLQKMLYNLIKKLG